MVRIGRYNRLTVIKLLPRGAQLDGQGLGEILLPKQYLTEDTKIGDTINVFIYLDSQDRLVATTDTPLGQVDEFVWLRVADVNAMGGFLDWGLPKDVFVPYSEQRKPLEIGKKVLARIYLDDSDRIAASTKLDSFLYDEAEGGFEVGQEVDLIVAQLSDLGRKVIVDGTHWGLIYHDEIFRELRMGQRTKAYIKRVRPDKKLEISLQAPGYQKIEGIAGQVLARLQSQDGFLPVHDKSAPALIKEQFGISKNSFKQAIGTLYKQRLISIDKDGIRLK